LIKKLVANVFLNLNRSTRRIGVQAVEGIPLWRVAKAAKGISPWNQ